MKKSKMGRGGRTLPEQTHIDGDKRRQRQLKGDEMEERRGGGRGERRDQCG